LAKWFADEKLFVRIIRSQDKAVRDAQ